MNIGKRTLAMILMLALVLTSFPIQVFAEHELTAEQSSEVGGVLPAANPVNAPQQPVDDGKVAVVFDFDMNLDTPPVLEFGHSHSVSQVNMDPKMMEVWKRLTITVRDQHGNKFESPKDHFVELDGITPSPNRTLRSGGRWSKDAQLTVTIDTNDLPENYHISYPFSSTRDGRAKWAAVLGYSNYTLKPIGEITTGALITLRIGAAWMYVEFRPEGGNFNGNTTPIKKFVNKDNTVDFPDDPVKDGLTFAGWYTERQKEETVTTAKGTHRVPKNLLGERNYWTKQDRFSDYDRDWTLFNDPGYDMIYDGNFVLRALWNATVTFDMDGGTNIDAQTVEEKKTATEPAQKPEKKNHKFLGWYTAKGNDGKEFDFGQAIMKNTTVYAHWEQQAADVTFDYNDGKTASKTETVTLGEKVTKPQDPTREGFTFKGWELGNGQPFNFDTPIDGDIILKAKWEKKQTPPTPPTPTDPTQPTDPTKPSTPDKPTGDKPSTNVPTTPGDKKPNTDLGIKIPSGSALPSSEVIRILAEMKKTVPAIPKAGVGR